MNVIEVKNLTKSYKTYVDKKATLKEKLLNFRSDKNNSKESIVLDEINLTIQKSEVVGLIGRNGSGKSTLLKLLSRIIYPDKGTVSIKGRVSSLLELGAGFHPDFTGLENIYMNASILGLTKKEIDENLDAILEFAELGEFIYRPVRVYSSGMYMRLAFSIAICVDPDVLLIDEILSVGDTAFQNKCLNRIRELMKAGKTIVIVTHDNGMVERLCTKAIWLHKGKIREAGKPKHVINSYLEMLNAAENKRRMHERKVRGNKRLTEEPDATITEKEKDTPDKTRWGNKEITLDSIKLFSKGIEQQVFKTNSSMVIQFDYHIHDSKKVKDNIVFGIGIYTTDGICCYGTNTFIDKLVMDKLSRDGRVSFIINDLNLVSGDYYFDIAVHQEDGTPYDYCTKCIAFAVRSELQDVGIARFNHKWEIEEKGEVVKYGV